MCFLKSSGLAMSDEFRSNQGGKLGILVEFGVATYR